MKSASLVGKPPARIANRSNVEEELSERFVDNLHDNDVNNAAKRSKQRKHGGENRKKKQHDATSDEDFSRNNRKETGRFE